jgi:uncharacterized protein YndB with AHSA1/START domain
MEPVTIHRHTELDLSVQELWDLVADPENLADWLGEAVELDLRAGGVGVVRDDGIERHVHVDRVDAGRELAFTWWHSDDPATTSRVVFEIGELPDVSSRLDITETMSVTQAHAARLDDARVRWEVRVLSLWACTVAVALVP